jgi:sirohydrochlorin ferrochelatase
MSSIILASHGTDNPVGAAAIHNLVEAVRAQLELTAPGTYRVFETFVDVQQPQVAQVLTQALTQNPNESAIIVPLLLSTGYHVRQDITDAVVEVTAQFPGSKVLVTPALGPSAELTSLLADRLEQAGWKGADRTGLAVAGSSDSAAVEECKLVHLELQEELRKVNVTNRLELAFLSAAEPRLKDLIPKLKFQNPRARLSIANYLLAPGYFNDQANKAGAHMVARPLLDPELQVPQQLIDVILRRVSEAELGTALGCLTPNDSLWSCAAGCATPCRS